MTYNNRVLLVLLAVVVLLVSVPGGVIAQDDADMPDYDGVVSELAIRRLNEGQDVAAFAEARDAFVALLQAEPGVSTDREFAPFIDFGTFAPPEPPVFIGMTEYENMEAFAAAGAALGETAEAGAFFSTFMPEVFTALRPLNAEDRYDLATIATEPGQVFEVAARDLSMYEAFDQADYEATRDAFLELLSEQDGFVAEFQWVSLLDPNIVVGMTVYESAEAFQAIATSEFAESPENTTFIGTYPPMVGYASFDARAAMMAQPTEAATPEMTPSE